MTKERKIKSLLNKWKQVFCYIKWEHSCIMWYSKVNYSGYKLESRNPFTIPMHSISYITFK